MELLESNDAKGLLLKKSAKHKRELEDEIKTLSANTERIITNALVIGGALALTFLLVRQLSKSKSKNKSKTKKLKVIKEDDSRIDDTPVDNDSGPSIVSQIGSALAAQATVFLLDLAKDKLSAYLQANFDKEAETSNERS